MKKESCTSSSSFPTPTGFASNDPVLPTPRGPDVPLVDVTGATISIGTAASTLVTWMPSVNDLDTFDRPPEDTGERPDGVTKPCTPGAPGGGLGRVSNPATEG